MKHIPSGSVINLCIFTTREAKTQTELAFSTKTDVFKTKSRKKANQQKLRQPLQTLHIEHRKAKSPKPGLNHRRVSLLLSG